MNEKKHEKNYGIEWLRILSMYMVAVLHTLGQGGILGSFKQGDLSFSIAWFLETAAFGAVDCFALISGYVGYHSHFRYKKGLRLWFQTFFYTLGITILFAIFMPEAVTKDQWIAAFFPIMKKQYWYITAYSGLFILIPILNRAIVNLSGRELLKICLAIFVVFSLIPTLLNETVFGLGGGYSAIWLLLLYICGGFWGKYHEICLTHLPLGFHFLSVCSIFYSFLFPFLGYIPVLLPFGKKDGFGSVLIFMDLTVFEIDSFGRVKAVSPLFCTFGPLIGDKTLFSPLQGR